MHSGAEYKNRNKRTLKTFILRKKTPNNKNREIRNYIILETLLKHQFDKKKLINIKLIKIKSKNGFFLLKKNLTNKINKIRQKSINFQNLKKKKTTYCRKRLKTVK